MLVFDGLSIVTGRACDVQMRLDVDAIDEEPCDIRIFHQSVEDSRQLETNDACTNPVPVINC
ncbi:hypothetical protein GPM19_02230 [Halomonas sp. ZH2S]|uniref:Uncharacterized protein n=1 Tax=Vreelandella zhuhanensis TaxID=2684210 RepID=A0A7X3GY31_9GAMM|nr:hypothetical protein [Halomonas zhuhanensis]